MWNFCGVIMTISGSTENLFKQFLESNDFKPTVEHFREVVERARITTAVTSGDSVAFYDELHAKLHRETPNLWKALNKRRSGSEYGGGTICKGANVRDRKTCKSCQIFTLIISPCSGPHRRIGTVRPSSRDRVRSPRRAHLRDRGT